MKTVKSREMMHRKGLVFGLMILLIVVIMMVQVSAITGSIGNSRMIINSKTGDTVERTILVKNVNNISVAIEMVSEGDLTSDLKIQNPNFTLAPGEEKKVNISIKVTKEGSTETKVNVKFTGVGEKGGVGLSSTIIINAEKGSLFDFGNSDPNSVSFFEKYKMIIIGSSVTLVLLIVFIVLLVIVSRKKKSKGMVNQKEMARPTKPKKESFKS